MKSLIKKATLANTLKSFAMCMVVLAANIQCVYVFHQPEQPSIIKKYRKF